MVRRLAAALAASAAVLAVVIAAPGTAGAGTGLRYRVVDTDNAHDGGVYYRNSPHWNDTKRITGVGGYYGEVVELVCGALGDAVGPYANRRWHLVDNISRPAAGRGWLPDRYLNTPNMANQRTPGEPECRTAPAPTQLPSGGSLYYSPYDGPCVIVSRIHTPWSCGIGWTSAPSPATLTMDKSRWYEPTLCTAGDAVPNLNGSANGRLITTLAGWSNGRNGPIMFLASKPPWWKQVRYILLFDPGDLAEYRDGTCDTKYPQKSSLVADWLAQNSANRLVVLAGAVTADYSHAGIQNYLFPAIRSYPVINGQNIRKRVVVCNYDGMSHHNVWINFKNKMNDAPITRSTCPTAPSYSHVVSWNP